jgi:hypothetical protein
VWGEVIIALLHNFCICDAAHQLSARVPVVVPPVVTPAAVASSESQVQFRFASSTNELALHMRVFESVQAVGMNTVDPELKRLIQECCADNRAIRTELAEIQAALICSQFVFNGTVFKSVEDVIIG